LLNQDSIAVLDWLLELTRQGRLVWESDPEDDFFAPTGSEGERVVIRRLWMEVVGRPGADPYQVELQMPGWTVRFPLAGDSDGCRRLCAILKAAGHPIVLEGGSPQRALEYLHSQFP
jgi:hypothetical protein